MGTIDPIEFGHWQGRLKEALININASISRLEESTAKSGDVYALSNKIDDVRRDLETALSSLQANTEKSLDTRLQDIGVTSLRDRIQELDKTISAAETKITSQRDLVAAEVKAEVGKHARNHGMIGAGIPVSVMLIVWLIKFLLTGDPTPPTEFGP